MMHTVSIENLTAISGGSPRSRRSQSVADLTTTSTTSGGSPRTRRPRSVSFSTIGTREYESVVVDHPEAGSNGSAPLLSIGWSYEEHEAVGLDDYEATRGDRRPMNEIRVYPSERKVMQKEASRASRRQEEANLKGMKKMKRKILRLGAGIGNVLSAGQEAF